MMALYGGGRPGSSRRVRLVPVRQSGMDHRAVARIVLALARQMAADEAVESAADEAVSSGAEVFTRCERGTSVGRCSANEPVSASPGSGLAGRCARQRHEGGAHYSPHEAAAPSSTPGGTP